MVTAVGFYSPNIRKKDNNPHDWLICGSKDCRISVWKYFANSKTISDKPRAIIYGHHNEIIALAIQKTLGLVASADKDGVVLIHCLNSGKLIRDFPLRLDIEESIRFVEMDDHGLLIIVTSKSKMISCTYTKILIRIIF